MENKDLHHTTQNQDIDPVTQESLMPEHDFDGIRELDNDPPFWLSFIFIITILIGYGYYAKYHIFKVGDLPADEYYNEMAPFMAPEENEGPIAPVVVEVALVAFTDATNLKSGADIYKTNCAVCHLSKGEGLVGPNLTDEFWIHGGGVKNVVNTITNGVPEKGMIAWRTQLSKDQILQVGSFILSLEGTNPPNAKAPQGDKYVPEAN